MASVNLEQYTNEQLVGITKKLFTDRQIALTVANELLTTPRFIKDRNQIFFGSANTKFSPTTLEYIKANIHAFSPYHLMTLYEYSHKDYFNVTATLLHTYFLVNDTTKEYVNFYNQPIQFIDMVREKWPITNKVKLVKRPYNYKHRLFTDKTEELLVQGLFNKVKVVDTAGPSGITIQDEDIQEEPSETQADIEERKARQTQLLKEIHDRLIKRYPELDAIVNRVKAKNSDMMVDIGFILPVRYIPQPGLVYNSKTRLVWRTELLPDLSNPSNEQLPFFEIIADLIDYMK
jgi:hypothetical protein